MSTKTLKTTKQVEVAQVESTHEFENFDMVKPKDWFEYTGWEVKGKVKQGETKMFLTFINTAKEKGQRGENIFFTENAGNLVEVNQKLEGDRTFWNQFMFMYIIDKATDEGFWMICCKESVTLTADDFDFED